MTPELGLLGVLLEPTTIVGALIDFRRRHPSWGAKKLYPGHPGRPMTPMDKPNSIWTADFTGQFRTPHCMPSPMLYTEPYGSV